MNSNYILNKAGQTIKFKKNEKSLKNKKISRDKYNDNNISNDDDNFWDIEIDNESNKNLNKFKMTSYNNIQNKNQDYDIAKNYTNYNKYKQLIKSEIIKNNNGNSNWSSFINAKIINNNKSNRNNSVDNNIRNKNKKKNRNKHFDKLSVYKRNKKWLDYRNEKLNKEIEKFINKKKNETYDNNRDYLLYKKKDYNASNVFNEEESVILKQENLRFFMRYIQGRQLREQSYDGNSSYAKINLLKYSHYSKMQNGNITNTEMKKYIKYMHNELKSIDNQN